MIDKELIKRLKLKATILRKLVIEMLAEAGSGHPGGSLSAADVVSVLYFHLMNHDPKNPNWPDRDRFVLSKGHACPVLYAAFVECGYFPKSEIYNLRKIDAMLQGHPDCRKTPGIEISTGSLGQGLSVGCGIALAAKLDKKTYHTYVLIGDGESNEGQIWEAALFAAHYKLDNLTCILDRNRLQIDGKTEEVMGLDPLFEKWKSFGWYTLEIDGHDYEQIINALDKGNFIEGKPKMVIANTIKGKGVSFMENVVEFHGKAPTKDEAKKALEELEKEYKAISET